MLVTSLSVRNIRTHDAFLHAIIPGVTLITGSNGSGKTSLIEALTVALRGTSFKGTDTELLQVDAPWWRIDVTTDDGRRTVKFDPLRTSGRKQFTIDDKHHIGSLRQINTQSYYLNRMICGYCTASPGGASLSTDLFCSLTSLCTVTAQIRTRLKAA